MDFNNLFINIFSSSFLILKRTLHLILTPYKTMREISLRGDKTESILLFLSSFLYLIVAGYLRKSVAMGIISCGAFILVFYVTAYFFYYISHGFNQEIKKTPFFITFSYTLIPTFFWVITNIILFILLPPPRTMSILGQGFSIIFIAYSISLLVWKLILVYFALRFSSKLGLYRIIYMMLLYLVIFVPLSLLLYYLKIFRIPFL